jgi:hypothetical protein
MAEPVHVDLMASKSRLRFLNAIDWVLVLDKAQCLNLRKDETLLQHGKQTEMLFMVIDGRATVKNVFGVVIARILGRERSTARWAFLKVRTRALP